MVLTGATGWVGRHFLHELQKIIPMEVFNEEVLAFGSKSSQVYSTAYKNKILIPSHPLSEIKNLLDEKRNFLIIHCAFLTREKISYYGINNYIEINKNILKNIEYALNVCDTKKSVLISSGAVESIEKKEINNIVLKKDPYGALKFEEEQTFKRLSNCLIMRIFGLTGKFIRDPNIFAFGNFLLSAKKKEAIIIKSKRHVIRSYGYGNNIARASIYWLLKEQNHPTKLINAATHTTNLIDLAKLISDIFDLPEVIYSIDNNLKKDIYVCENLEFRNFLKNLDIKPTNMEKQIIKTYKSLNLI